MKSPNFISILLVAVEWMSSDVYEHIWDRGNREYADRTASLGAAVSTD